MSRSSLDWKKRRHLTSHASTWVGTYVGVVYNAMGDVLARAWEWSDWYICRCPITNKRERRRRVLLATCLKHGRKLGMDMFKSYNGTWWGGVRCTIEWILLVLRYTMIFFLECKENARQILLLGLLSHSSFISAFIISSKSSILFISMAFFFQ